MDVYGMFSRMLQKYVDITYMTGKNLEEPCQQNFGYFCFDLWSA